MQMTLTGGVSGAEIITVLFASGTLDINAAQVPLIPSCLLLAHHRPVCFWLARH